MELKEIRQLIRVVENADISELEIVEEGKKLRISKNSRHTVVNQPAAAQTYQPPPVSGATMPTEVMPTRREEPVGTAAEQPAGNIVEVRSPMVGTFYRAPAPGSEPFVEIGEPVAVGQTVGIVEAMKLMNEIGSDFNGVIRQVLIENAQPVEFGQPLFLVEIK